MSRRWTFGLMAMFLMAVFLTAEPAQASNRRGYVTLGKASHQLKLPAYFSNGKYFLEPQVMVNRTGGLRLGKVDRLCFHSERTGWDADCTARSVARKIVRDSKGLWAVYILSPTLRNDWGTWRIWLKSDCSTPTGGPWFNLDKLVVSGQPWARKDNMIRYGEYRAPAVSFEAPGNIEIRWYNNNLFGFMSPLKASEVAYVRWNANSIGWFVNNATCVPEKDYLGEYFCFIAGLPSSDRGAFTAIFTDGGFVWMNNSMWTFSPNVTLYDDGTIGYILPPLSSRLEE